MLIDLTEEEITLFKKFVDLFSDIGAYVHEGVMITVQFNGGADDHEAARNLGKFLDECYWPPYLDMLQSIMDQIDGQIKQLTLDPKRDMITQWDMILERDCMCNSREDYVSLHDGIRDHVDNFYAQIGEAMGPVSYAGFQLTQALKNKNLSTDWVSNCIQYYQDNWDF
ncbi:MAG: hypothetical protein IKQ22_03590 [Clostridia bacterium]|nr:hypothetical protein [Clostridia bacterium]